MRNTFLKVVSIASIALVGSNIAAQATTLSSTLNVDNEYSIFLSTDDSVAGTEFGSGNKWWMTYNDVSPLLTPGVVHYLHIQATDWGGIAGLLGEFTLSDAFFAFGNGTQSMLTADAGIRVSTTGWENYVESNVIGINSVSPWRDRNTNNKDAHWIWSADPNNDNYAFFSAPIYPVFQRTELQAPIAEAPLPAGAVLLMSALGGMALARRRSRTQATT